jgi:hypothetical protein
VEIKTCNICGETKSVDLFPKRYNRCKVCHSAKRKAKHKAYYEANKEKKKAWREANKEELAAKKKAWYEANKEKVKAQKKAYREANKEKIEERDKVYREANKEKKSVYDQSYREANQEKVAANHKAYYEANKEKIQAYQRDNRERIRERERGYYQKPAVKVRNSLASRLYKTLKRVNTKKMNNTLDMCGCTLGEVMNHLESQFAEGMSWDNYGEWHIDHIRPCASFDMTKEEEQLECFHYTNLQPLWGVDNMSKGSLWDGVRHSVV